MPGTAAIQKYRVDVSDLLPELHLFKAGRGKMRAVVFDGTLVFRDDYPEPAMAEDWALVRVSTAGICQTDIELTRGYMGFKGVLGHEFVGHVTACCRETWIGRRVVAEINNACGNCPRCRQGLPRHCAGRTVLGIVSRDGCMADYCTVPVENLVAVPETVSDNRAVLIEPLAAACQILEQVAVRPRHRVVVIGDGRLGILCAWVLTTAAQQVTLVGRHASKLAIAGWRHLKTTDTLPAVQTADIVVDATGSPTGLEDAIAACRPRGTIVLKSTIAGRHDIHLAPLVINELTLVGSRCGSFRAALEMLNDHDDMPLERLITARFRIDQACAAFDAAGSSRHLKVLLDMAG